MKELRDLKDLPARTPTSARSDSEAGSYLRIIDSFITQLKAQNLLGPVTRVKKKKKKREYVDATW